MLDLSSSRKATPFDYGAGHVRPNRAMDPGLIYDLKEEDYLNFLCVQGYNQTQIKLFSPKPHSCPNTFTITDFNYPSFTIPNLNSHPITLTRRVKNVGAPAKYYAHVKEPAGVSVLVEPKMLEFEKIGEEKTFKVTFEAKKKFEPLDYVFGRLIWSDGKHYVRSPLVVKHS